MPRAKAFEFNFKMNGETALILAAGRGERLRPITDCIPKPLIKVGKHRLIEYHLFNLAESGIKTIYINRAHLREKFEQLLSTDRHVGINLIYLDEPDGALETAGAIINAFANTDSDKLLVVNGDIWCDYKFNNIKHLPDSLQYQSHVILVKNPEHNSNGDFSLKGNKLLKKSANSPTYTFSGIGIYCRSVFANENLEYKKLAPILSEQIESGRISATIHDGEWMDIGTVERLEILRSKLAEKSL